MRPLPWLFAALAFASGCIPVRDNPNDRVNAPVLSLRVVDRHLSRIDDDTCPPLTAGEDVNWTPVVTAFRGTCLALDATATKEGENSLSLTFEELDEAGAVVGAPLVVESGGKIALVALSRLRTLPVGVPVAFRVTGRTSGVTRRVVAPFSVANRAPRADAGPMRRWPEGGIPRAPGPIPVTLDATGSTDEDGDPIVRWSWTLPGDATGACGDEPVCSFMIPPSVGRRLAKLAVDDGAEISRPAVIELSVGALPAWAAGPRLVNFTGSDHVLEYDGLFRATFFPALPLEFQDGDFLDGPAGPRIALGFEVGGTGRVVLASWPDARPLDAVDLPAGEVPMAIRAVPGTASFWVASRIGFDYRARLFSGPDTLTLDAGPLLLDFADTGFLQDDFLFGYDAVDGEGRHWQVPLVSGTAYVTSASSQVTRLLAGVDHQWAGFDANPATGVMWGMKARRTTSSQLAPSRIVRFTGVPGEELAWELPSAFTDVAGLAWVDGERFWMNVPALGMALVDATRLPVDGSMPSEDAIELVVPDAIDVSHFFVEKATQRVFVTTRSFDRIYRIETDGALIVIEPGADVITRFLDTAGAAWSSQGVLDDSRLRRARSDGPPMATFPIASAATPAVDPVGDVLWLATITPSALVAYSPDGRVLDYISEMTVDGVPQGLPFPIEIAPEPGGSGIWMLAADSDDFLPYFRLDLTGRDPAMRHRVRAVQTQTPGTPFLVSSFFQAAPGKVWSADAANPFVRVERVLVTTTAGASTNVFPVPPSERIFGLGRSPAEDSACIVTTPSPVGAVVPVRIYRVDETGAGSGAPIAMLTRNASTSFVGGGAVATSDPEMCWVAMSYSTSGSITTEIVAVDATSGAVVRQITGIPGPVVDSQFDGQLTALMARNAVSAEGPNRVFYLRDAGVGAQSVVVRLVFDPIAGTWSTDSFPAADARSLLHR